MPQRSGNASEARGGKSRSKLKEKKKESARGHSQGCCGRLVGPSNVRDSASRPGELEGAVLVGARREVSRSSSVRRHELACLRVREFEHSGCEQRRKLPRSSHRERRALLTLSIMARLMCDVNMPEQAELQRLEAGVDTSPRAKEMHAACIISFARLRRGRLRRGLRITQKSIKIYKSIK